MFYFLFLVHLYSTRTRSFPFWNKSLHVTTLFPSVWDWASHSKAKESNCNKTTTATNFTDQKSSLPQEFRIFAISWTDLYLFVLQGTSDCSGQALLKLKSLIQSTKLDLWLLELKFSKCEREHFKTKPNNNNGLTLTKKINK